MTTEKIFGFILVFLGVAIILYALYSSYAIFTGAKNAPEIFLASIEKEAASTPGDGSLENIQAQLGGVFQEQLSSILPVETISKTLNLFSWSVLSGILIFGGGQLAGIGIKLLKTKNTV